MQVVAVTDPLELGFARQAMIGIRASGQLEPIADAVAALDEVDYVVITAGSYDLLVEVVCESDEELLAVLSTKIRTIPNVDLHRDLHVPPAAQADLLLGRALSTAPAPRLGRLSLWHETADDDWSPAARAARRHRRRRRVVGAGFTGLWTAYYLLERGPDAAGRRARGRDGRLRRLGPQRRLVLGAVPRVPGHAGRAARLEPRRRPRAAPGDARHRRRGARGRRRRGHRRPGPQGRHRRAGPHRRPAGAGPVTRSRTPGPGAAARTTYGCSTPGEARARLDATGTLGGTFTPDCAAIHPARLVRGLARAVERRGGRIHERTRVRAIEPGRAVTDHGVVRADVVVRATEGYTAAPRRPCGATWCRSTR